MTDTKPERITTGVAGLDRITGGGWWLGRVYVVSGTPGAGKTIFGNQNCFAHLRGGGRALYVTVLSESSSGMLKHLEKLTFFERERIGDSLLYVSGYGTLRDGGLDALRTMLGRGVRDHGASLLVVDGLSAVRELAKSTTEYREFLHELATHNALAQCTTLLLTSRDDVPHDPDHAIVDGILAMGSRMSEMTSIRTLEVRKFRGASQLTGEHCFDIRDEGLTVYPRPEALYAAPFEEGVHRESRCRFGIETLDEMVNGGLPRISSTLLMGSPGVGKTTLGLHFLTEGAEEGERGLYFGFGESSERLLQKASAVGIPLQPHVESGRVRLVRHVPVEPLPDALVDHLMRELAETQSTRVVIDGIDVFANELVDSSRAPRLIAALQNELRRRGVTAIFTQHTNSLFGPELFAPIRGADAILDNILFLRFYELHGRLSRFLSVLKMRDSSYDRNLRTFEIDDTGVVISDRIDSASSMFTGLAQPEQERRPLKRHRSLLGRRKRS